MASDTGNEIARGRIIAAGRLTGREADLCIREIFEKIRTVAVLGLSPKPGRDSHKVARYLQEERFRIIPVRPGQSEILGEPAVASLSELTAAGISVDMVDAFRNSGQIPSHVEEVIALKPRVFWMQLGIEHEEAAEAIAAAGIDVVMNRCTKVEYERLVRRRAII